ncbi:uncharacterized protein LOC120486385 [Pimephales promelas]|uniref:uncharacterized protein LOC120486385 n=1 Tax=Pimephales promelas TaxID=90988 RepID=UPI00195597DC|nr:uncharacterized protein LOC120486385 [Pimephales promelas]
MKKMFLKLVLLCLCLWRLDVCVSVGGMAMIVSEGDSVSLNSRLTEMKDDDVIQWNFEDTLIAEIYKRADRIALYDDVLDGRLRDRLKLDNQTGSLTITRITTEDTGVYNLLINSAIRERIGVVVVGVIPELVSEMEGDSVSLNSHLTEIKDDDVIQWRFGKTLIAEINKRADRFTVYDDVLDGRFRDRLKLDNQTGSLIITHITTENEGDYQLLTNRIRKFKLYVSGDFTMLVPVLEGYSSTLNSSLTEIKDDYTIQWRFGKTLIADIDKRAGRFTVYDDVLDGRFRDRLKLDKQTASLTITNTTTEHEGDYELLTNRIRRNFKLMI